MIKIRKKRAMTLIELPAVRKRAMTLIELLISLFIIALMAGVALPAFSYYQRRGQVESDAQALVQLLNYARALQNNPDSFSRSSGGGSYNYELKLANDGKNQPSITLYSAADPGTIIDRLNFAENLEVNYQNSQKNSGDGLKISFSGQPPKESIICSDQSTLCDRWISIILSARAPYQSSKTIKILNTNDSLKQVLSISLN